MKSKYNMTKEANIFFAKRKLIDNIYKSANLEGIAVTFADTVSFMNNVNTGKISVDDMLKLKGLKDAWEFVLNTIDEELTIDYIKKVHTYITKTQDNNFDECNYEEELNNILNNDNKLDSSLDLFCWIQRSQMFLDGNKRVANLVANKEMIRNGQGIIAVSVDKIGEFFTKLINYYETGNNTDLKKWLYETSIDGVE